jgi:excinuclease ABC subunit A
MKQKNIRFFGIKTHNLKNINLEILAGKLTSITGISGSGKSSLAFDTIFAEGNRRYIDTLSTYTRQFLEKIDPPPIDKVENIRPAIALKQHNPNFNNRSTVGIITEISPLLREIFANFSTLYCPTCGIPVYSYTLEKIIEIIQQIPKSYLLLPLNNSNLKKQLQTYLSFGFTRIFSLSEQKLIFIEEYLHHKDLPDTENELFILVDRFKNSSSYSKIKTSLELAHKFLKNTIYLWKTGNKQIDKFPLNYKCPQCNTSFTSPSPQLFSFNSPLGACTECQGFGKIPVYDETTLIPHPEKTLSEGAIDI